MPGGAQVQAGSQAKEWSGGREAAHRIPDREGAQGYRREGRSDKVALMGPFDPRTIANRMLDYAEQQGLHLTVMHLLKLVYLAHGWWLTFSNGSPLTTAKPEAWRYGPVYRDVYNAFIRYGRGPVIGRAVDGATGYEYREDMSEEVEHLLEHIVSSYGKHYAFTLSKSTNKPAGPWSVTVEKRGYYAPIEHDMIRKHFDGLRQKPAAA